MLGSWDDTRGWARVWERGYDDGSELLLKEAESDDWLFWARLNSEPTCFGTVPLFALRDFSTTHPRALRSPWTSHPSCSELRDKLLVT